MFNFLLKIIFLIANSILGCFFTSLLLKAITPSNPFVRFDRPESGLTFILAIPISFLLVSVLALFQKKVPQELYLTVVFLTPPLVTSILWIDEWRNHYRSSEIYAYELSHIDTIATLLGSEKAKIKGVKLYQDPYYGGSSYFSDSNIPDSRVKFFFDVKSIYIGKNTIAFGCTEEDFRGMCDKLYRNLATVDRKYISFYFCENAEQNKSCSVPNDKSKKPPGNKLE